MDESEALGCRIIAEFEDDAAHCFPNGAAAAPVTSAQVEPRIQDYGLAAPTRETTGDAVSSAAARKKLWLKAIHRLTQPVPGKRHGLRVPHFEDPEQARISIESCCRCSDSRASAIVRSSFTAYEVDIADKQFLVLFDNQRQAPDAVDPMAPQRVRETSTYVQWTEIVHIRSEVLRRARPDPQSEAG